MQLLSSQLSEPLGVGTRYVSIQLQNRAVGRYQLSEPLGVGRYQLSEPEGEVGTGKEVLN